VRVQQIDVQAAAAIGDDVGLVGALVDDEQREQALQAAREAFCPVGEILLDEPGRIAPALGGKGQPQAKVGDPDLTVGGTGDAPLCNLGSLGPGSDRKGCRGTDGAIGDLHALEPTQRPHAFLEARGFSLADSGNEHEGVAHSDRLYGLHARKQAEVGSGAASAAPSLDGLPVQARASRSSHSRRSRR